MKHLNLISALILFALLSNACASKQKSYAYSDAPKYMKTNADSESYDKESVLLNLHEKQNTYDLSHSTADFNRLIIYNASLNLTVKERDSLLQKLEKISKFHGGYVSSFSENRVVLKVQNDRLNAAMTDLQKLGKVSNQSINAQDVTTAYRDLEIALDNAEKARLRYLQLFEQAKTVTEMVLIEKELERIIGQIERYKAQINNYNQRIQFAEITIYLHNKVKPGIIGYLGIGLYKSVKWLFVR